MVRQFFISSIVVVVIITAIVMMGFGNLAIHAQVSATTKDSGSFVPLWL
jgi:hypothetical protein